MVVVFVGLVEAVCHVEGEVSANGCIVVVLVIVGYVVGSQAVIVYSMIGFIV